MSVILQKNKNTGDGNQGNLSSEIWADEANAEVQNNNFINKLSSFPKPNWGVLAPLF